MQLVLNHCWFKQNEFKPEKVLQNKKKEKDDNEENKKLLCKFCKSHVTNIDDAISVEGNHTHTFSNPAGYVYTISCYQSAPGCMVAGKKTNEYSWFKNHDWQIAFCNSCQEQLGWLFTNGKIFYALIADRLIQE